MTSRVVSPTEIEVTLDAEALKAVGKYGMVVRNPDPIDPAVVRACGATEHPTSPTSP